MLKSNAVTKPRDDDVTGSSARSLVNHGHLGCASGTSSLSLRQSTRYLLDLAIVGNAKHLAGC